MNGWTRISITAITAAFAWACGGSAPKPTVTETTEAASAESTEGSTEVREQQVDEAPEVSEEATALLAGALEEAAAGNISAARGQFSEAAAADPKLAEAHFNLGVLAEWEGDATAARRHYDDALRARADFGPAVRSIARMMLRDNQGPGALGFAESQVKLAPDSNAVQNAATWVKLQLGRHNEVVTEAKQVLRRDEKNVAAMKNLAGAFHAQKKYELALAIIENAMELDPEDPELYFGKAMAHLGLKDKIRARLALEKASGLPTGGSAETHNNLGVMYHEAGDFAGAESEYRKALARAPGFLAAQVNLGNALKGQQKYAEASEALLKAKELGPRAPEVPYNLGILYLDGQIPDIDSVQRLEQALRYFEEYRRLAAPLKAGDPVNDYIVETQKRIEIEKQLEAQRRNQPKAPEGGETGGGEAGGGEAGGGETGGDEGFEDAGGDEGFEDAGDEGFDDAGGDAGGDDGFDEGDEGFD
jgi:tetratricopeptide (TPR) repeat protein